MSEFEEVVVESASKDSGSESLGEKTCSFDLNHDPPETKPSTNFKTKIYHVGSGNIIGKNIIQEFFNCAGVIPIISGSILDKTNCYVDAIAMLVVKLERIFLHIHPALQKIFYELPNIHDPRAKKIATIILMHEFDYIIREARGIFSFYKINFEHPPIEEILHDKDTIRRLESKDYFAYGKNIRRRVPYAEIIKTMYHHACDKFEWVTKGIDEGFSEKWFESTARDPIDDEIHVLYEDVYGDDPEFEVMNVKITNQSPFYYLSSPTRKEEHESRELMRNFLEDLIKKDLGMKDDNT
jgi:hypothetical protein